jgi:hypothetical protein
MEREIIQGDQKLTQTEFYKWLQEQTSEGIQHLRFADAAVTYFGKPQPFFGDHLQANYHRYVFEEFWRVRVIKKRIK